MASLNAKTCKKIRAFVPNWRQREYQILARIAHNPDVPQAPKEGFHMVRAGLDAQGNPAYAPVVNPIRVLGGRGLYRQLKKEARRAQNPVLL